MKPSSRIDEYFNFITLQEAICDKYCKSVPRTGCLIKISTVSTRS